jgi:hypothetical protein
MPLTSSGRNVMKGRGSNRYNTWLLLLLLIFLGACNRTSSVAPSDIGVAVTADAVTITWQDNSEGETGFAVDRKLVSDTDFIELAVLDPNVVTYTDTTVVVGESYIYRVRALGVEGGEVSSTETDPVTPAPSSETATLTVLFASNSTGQGTVTSSPEGVNCALESGSVCQITVSAGSTVTLTATPSETSTFASWSEGCESTVPTCEVQMTEDKTVRVRFVPVLNTLTVRKAGDGVGRVTSGTPPDIDCGNACVASYDVTTTFRLRATPEPGSSFAGWSENCKPVGSLCEVTIGGGQGSTVTATFNKIPPPAIESFAVNPTLVPVGGNVTFSWTVTGQQVTTLVLKDNKPATADIPVTGTSYTLQNVQETTTYTLTATNAFGSSTVSQPVTVTVGSPPALANLAATPNPDGTFTLTWTATGNGPITYRLIDVLANAEVAPAPTGSPYTFTPPTLPGAYRLEASSPFGVATPQIVTLVAPVPATIVSFAALPNFILSPGNVTLTWAVTGNEPFTELTITASDGRTPLTLSGPSGSLPVPVERDVEFTLNAANAFGRTSSKIAVGVGIDAPPPPGTTPAIASFSSSSESVSRGTPITLSWQIANPQTMSGLQVRVTPGQDITLTDLTATGVTFTPTRTARYQLVVTTPGGRLESQEVRVRVTR